jgi:hypothetical protein
MANVEVDRLAGPARVFSRRDVLVRPSPVPSGPGVYGWCFRRWSSTIAADRCCSHQGLALLYARISPDRPPRKGRPPSKQNLAGRIRYHYTGNAEGSTLRKTLGCLLAGGLGIQLWRVGSGSRMTFGAGEQVLSPAALPRGVAAVRQTTFADPEGNEFDLVMWQQQPRVVARSGH